MSKYTPKPKVAAAIVAGIIASAVLANIDLITPDLFEGLGKWSHLVYGLTITLVMSAAGWLKSDAAATPPSEDNSDPVTPMLDRPPATFPAAAVEAVMTPADPVAPVFTPPAP